MRLQTIEALSKAENAFVMGNGGMEVLASSRSTPWRVLKGRMMEKISTLTEECRALNIDYSNIIEEMLRFIRQTIADEQRLPSDRTEWGSLPVEQSTYLPIPVSDFQEADVSRSTARAAAEQRPSATAILETIGYGSRLAERKAMGICEGG